MTKMCVPFNARVRGSLVLVALATAVMSCPSPADAAPTSLSHHAWKELNTWMRFTDREAQVQTLKAEANILPDRLSQITADSQVQAQPALREPAPQFPW